MRRAPDNPRPNSGPSALLVSAALSLLALLLAACAPAHIASTPVAHTRSAPNALHGPAAPVAATALTALGAPYVWGGESPAEGGFDCSGLVWWAYRNHGITLPRISWQQFGAGESIPLSQVRSGDLVFFKTERTGKGFHVGIVTRPGVFVHAPRSGGRVKESAYTTSFWRNHFAGARRIIR